MLSIDTTVGDPTQVVLCNVTKVEKFLTDEIHRFLEEECIWPNYHTIIIKP
jgi:distribution and morphology protein 12